MAVFPPWPTYGSHYWYRYTLQPRLRISGYIRLAPPRHGLSRCLQEQLYYTRFEVIRVVKLGALLRTFLLCQGVLNWIWKKEVFTICETSVTIHATSQQTSERPENSQQWAQSQLATDTLQYPTAVSRMGGHSTRRHVSPRAVTAWSRTFPRAIRSHCKVTHQAQMSSVVRTLRSPLCCQDGPHILLVTPL
jgi:hypothetical protein